MNIQLMVIAIVSAIVTIPVVLFIPHQRRSLWFNRVLWASTWLLAILGAFLVINNWGNDSVFSQPNLFQLPIIPTCVGIVAGALSVHVLLGLMDRFALSADEFAEDENEEQ